MLGIKLLPFIRRGLRFSFLVGIQSRVNVCGSWATFQKSLKMKASWVFWLFFFWMIRTSTFKLYLNVCLTPGAGTLRAKFELSNGPSTPSTLAVQFLNEGTTLSGADMELQGSGYRLSLNKKRFATGMTDAPHLGTPSLITRLQLRPFCSFLRTIHGRLLRWPTTLPPNTKQKPQKKPHKKTSQPCEAFRPLGSVWAQMVCETRISLQENSTEYWTLSKTRIVKEKKRWAFRKHVDIKSNNTS